MVRVVSNIAYHIWSFGVFVHDIRNTIYGIRSISAETDLITFTGPYRRNINSEVFIGIS
jgi:hypothetical protein